MSSIIGRVIGAVVGLLLIFMAVGGFESDMGTSQSNMGKALLALLAALGVGILGAAMLPNTITVDGKDIKPLGLGLNATGGAAFFVVALIFIYYTNSGDAKADSKPPLEEEVKEDQDTEKKADDADPVDPEKTDDPKKPTDRADPEPERETASKSDERIVYRYRTYCHTCCPMGPNNCPQVGFGRSYSEDAAVNMAIDRCVANGGLVPTCELNIEAY